jgi:hypothetical protein
MPAYAIELQLPSISGGCLLHPQQEDMTCHAMVTRDILNMAHTKLKKKL